jgi:hypothetical protein
MLNIFQNYKISKVVIEHIIEFEFQLPIIESFLIDFY